MARSAYVYVLECPREPPRAWTVKHELRTWLRGQDIPEDWVLWRAADAGPDVPRTEMSIQDVLEGSYGR
jgi:hypothetical protein